MTASRISPLLRRTLLADAALSGTAGLTMVFDPGILPAELGAPAALTRAAGLALLPFAAFLVWLARRETVPLGAVWAVILGNLLWAVDSLLLLATGWIDPTAIGTAFVLVQAAAVAAFAELQYVGLRRSPAVPA